VFPGDTVPTKADGVRRVHTAITLCPGGVCIHRAMWSGSWTAPPHRYSRNIGRISGDLPMRILSMTSAATGLKAAVLNRDGDLVRITCGCWTAANLVRPTC